LELPAEDEKEIPWWRSDKKAWRATAIASRPLRVLHLLITVMNTVGAIILAHRSIGIRPGERIAISIPDYGTASVNFYCTAGSVQNPGTKPTVWLEGSSSQGITDFLGIQHYLLDHDIASCSYDPPNFGGSDALPISFTDDEDWVPALIRRLDVDPFYSPSDTTRNRTFIGWGSAGMKLAVEHALSDDHASMVIALDPMPDGVEYLIAQMGHDWSNTERLQYRLSDLATRVFQRRLLLSFGIGW
jgi:pimeloyl-ACP methyl ester carboxylesterase